MASVRAVQYKRCKLPLQAWRAPDLHLAPNSYRDELVIRAELNISNFFLEIKTMEQHPAL
jgi:hypothetical protein